jgi:hypothetical protein
MRNLYCLVKEIVGVTPLMAAAMRRGVFIDEMRFEVSNSSFPDAFKAALLLMQSVGGYALETKPMLFCIESGQKHNASPLEAKFQHASHMLILHALPGVLLSCGEETVPLNTGECWWWNNKMGLGITNNSKDDLVFLSVNVLIDE